MEERKFQGSIDCVWSSQSGTEKWGFLEQNAVLIWVEWDLVLG